MDIKYKNITILSGNLLAKLQANGKSWFTIKQAYELFPEIAKKSVSQQIMLMVNKGLLMRIREGVYYIIPYEQDSETFMPDWHLLAEPLARGTYYIGFYSALQIHQLITQPSLKEQIVVKKRVKPSEITIKGVKFQFIYPNEKHFFGHKKIWIDNYNKVFCSDLEKTVIDCLYKPDYAGSIVEIAKAIYRAKDKINYETLLNYTMLFDSQVVIKRLGYLLELLKIETPIIEMLRNNRSSSIALLDTEAPKDGKVLSRWNIQQNVDIETIKTAILT
jgi:predicted transcriptional regulator of viral defense system